MWSRLSDSNRPPDAYKATALPNELRRRKNNLNSVPKQGLNDNLTHRRVQTIYMLKVQNYHITTINIISVLLQIALQVTLIVTYEGFYTRP